MHGDADLETRLPAEVRGVRLATYSLEATDFVSPANEVEFNAFLDDLDKAMSDATIAVANDPTGQVMGSILALRVAGSPTDSLLNALLNSRRREAVDITVEPRTVDGRSISTLTWQALSPPRTEHIYATGDIVFSVTAADDATATDLISALP